MQGKKKAKTLGEDLEDDEESTTAMEMMSRPQAAVIASVQPHPSADKLKVCIVDTGSGLFKVCLRAPFCDVTTMSSISYLHTSISAPSLHL